MDLDSLGLDRNLNKDYGDNPAYTNDQSNELLSAQDNASATGAAPQQDPGSAYTVAPGSIIASCFLQSSPGADRVEINPDDNFYAYNDGTVVVTINKAGIDADRITAGEINIFNGLVNILPGEILLQNISLGGVTAPLMNLEGFFTAVVDAAGTLTSGRVNDISSWSVSHPSTGIYIVTHGLGLTLPYLSLFVTAPIIGYTADAFNLDGNSFEVSIADISTTSPVDSDFYFLAIPL